MNVLRIWLVAVAIAMAGAPSHAAATFPVPLDPLTNPLFKRMVALNTNLRSYEASVKFDVAMKSFPYISPTLAGNVYFKKPDKQAVVFDTVPVLAAQFKKVYPNLDAPMNWPAKFEIAIMSDDNGMTLFRLVPKVNGRIEHLDVKVSDADATVVEYTWTYKDGGYVTFDQLFQTIAGNYLVQKQTGHVDLPSYKADVSSNFSDYKLNVALSDSIFEPK